MNNHDGQNSLYKIPTNKNFGYTFTIVFFIISLYFVVFTYNITFFIIFLLVSITFLSVTLAKPYLLAKPNLIWFKFGILISKIINPLILGLLFYIIFTPISLWFKIIKRDVLKTNFHSGSSYWNKKIKYKSSMTNQF